MLKIAKVGKLPSYWEIYKTPKYKALRCLGKTVPFININDLEVGSSVDNINDNFINLSTVSCLPKVVLEKSQAHSIPKIITASSNDNAENLLLLSVEEYKMSSKADVDILFSHKSLDENDQSHGMHYCVRLNNKESFFAFYSGKKHFVFTWDKGLVEDLDHSFLSSAEEICRLRQNVEKLEKKVEVLSYDKTVKENKSLISRVWIKLWETVT